MAKLTYAEQLKHPSWQKRRLEIMQRDEFKCAMCYDSESMLHVHHKHYFKGRMAWEYADDELVTLCESCHSTSHERDDQLKRLLASLPIDGPFNPAEAMALVAGWAKYHLDDIGESHRQASPYAFILGEIADLVEAFSFNINPLLEVRDALASVPIADRAEALLRMARQLRERDA